MARKIIKLKKIKQKRTTDDNNFFKLRLKLSDILLAIVVLALTFMLTTQLNTVSKSGDILQNKREAQLADDLLKLKENYNGLKKVYDENKLVVEEYRGNYATNDKLIGSMKQELTVATSLAGLKSMKGEGLVINIEDSKRQPTADVRAEDLIIHNTDLESVVNELKIAGAEAISINGNRVLANTSIRCVGPVILINDQKIASPFVIKVIGNAQYLESALSIKGGIADYLRKYGKTFTMHREKEVIVEKYDGALSFKYAQIAE